MIIKNVSSGLNVSRKVHAKRYDMDGQCQPVDQMIVSEHFISLYVNDEPYAEMVCSAKELSELVIGHVFSQGLVSDASDIEAVFVGGDGRVAQVYTKDRKLNRREGVSRLPAHVWKPEWVFSMVGMLEGDTPLYEKTNAAHCCLLAYDGRVVYKCEDVGRHNAMDKVIGCAVADGLDLSRCSVYCSGRVPLDMLEKTVRSGIPVLVSHSAPTDASIELAKRCGATLICSARQDYMVVYNDGMDGR